MIIDKVRTKISDILEKRRKSKREYQWWFKPTVLNVGDCFEHEGVYYYLLKKFPNSKNLDWSTFARFKLDRNNLCPMGSQQLKNSEFLKKYTDEKEPIVFPVIDGDMWISVHYTDGRSTKKKNDNLEQYMRDATDFFNIVHEGKYSIHSYDSVEKSNLLAHSTSVTLEFHAIVKEA